MRSHDTRNRRRGPGRRAFTLMEIIVVVTIIALLAGIIVPRMWARVSGAKQAAAKNEVKLIAAQVITYMMDAGLSQLDDDFDLDILIATPEKALADLIIYSAVELEDEREVEEYLYADLRMDREAPARLNAGGMRDIARNRNSSTLRRLAEYLGSRPT